MTQTARKLMTVEEFFDWQRDQDERYELVDGVPVIMADPLTMMARASTQHDTVATNILVSLGNQLRDTACRPATAHVGIRTRQRSLRRADVLVLCDPPRLDQYEALEPRMVVEVLSPRNKGLSWQRKIEEYRQHEKLVYLLLVDSEAPAATLVTRDGERWVASDCDGIEAVVELPLIGCRLALAEAYWRIAFGDAR